VKKEEKEMGLPKCIRGVGRVVRGRGRARGRGKGGRSGCWFMENWSNVPYPMMNRSES
jgi:hypothetical protein